MKTCLYSCAFVLALTPGPRAQEAPPYPPSQQEASGPPPAHIAIVDGAATVERDGQSQPAMPNAPFVPGDRLRTTTGRVDVLFPDGTALDVDQSSSIDLQSPTLLRLISGRVILVVSGAADPASAVRYQIDTPAASARIDGAGEYRVAVLDGRSGAETELAVLRGSAALATERGSMPIHAGERTVARVNEAPAFPQAFNSARFDAFDEWALQQQKARTGAASAQYLPQDLQMYGGALDRSGSWQYTAPYGYAWYPAVAPDWQPYYYGSWSAYQPWGWTWIGADVWAWPTHHYGRWGFSRNGWFWVPGRTWGPAWVSWASAPGYVSWCPLGFDGRPVFSLSSGFGHARAGWTVVPRSSFGFRGRVDRFAVPPHRLQVADTAFVPHRAAPVDVPRTAHVVNVPHGAGRIVDSRQSIVERRQSTVESPRTGVALPRAGEFKQPLPEGFRALDRVVSGSVPAQRAEPRGTAPAATPSHTYGTPRSAYPDRVYSGTPSPGTAYPRSAPSGTATPRNDPGMAYPSTTPPSAPHATQAPQAVPRSSPQPAERRPEGASRAAAPAAAPAPPAHVERQSAPAAPPPPRAERPSAQPRSGAPSGGGGASHSGGSSQPSTPHSRGRGGR